jgi:hypothetical protein
MVVITTIFNMITANEKKKEGKKEGKKVEELEK